MVLSSDAPPRTPSHEGPRGIRVTGTAAPLQRKPLSSDANIVQQFLQVNAISYKNVQLLLIASETCNMAIAMVYWINARKAQEYNPKCRMPSRALPHLGFAPAWGRVLLSLMEDYYDDETSDSTAFWEEFLKLLHEREKKNEEK